MSYVCCDPMAGIHLDDAHLRLSFPDGKTVEKTVTGLDLNHEISEFRRSFQYLEPEGFKFITNGLFGYFAFEAVEYFEDIKLSSPGRKSRDIPLLHYQAYRFVIAIDHFKNELFVFEHVFGDDAPRIEQIVYIIQNKNFPEYGFTLKDAEESNQTDEEFKELVEKMKAHIFRGDVFQIVPSRAFSRAFSGDEFNVYRALRSINPSPYLFYFDYGSYKIFGSSPEAQLTIKNREASIYPIAGTFKRSGDDELDFELAEKLKSDPKESAEHVMLVDLARNDLSRHCNKVEVKSYKEAQYFSHVIHLVSKVSGTLDRNVDSFTVVGDTFPAGTLSGAPKHKALSLIDAYENFQRGFYSGAIGFMGFNGAFNHAIMIRSFLSKANTLHYQAGAGIVADSDADKELQEVNNKIAALRTALEFAQTINS